VLAGPATGFEAARPGFSALDAVGISAILLYCIYNQLAGCHHGRRSRTRTDARRGRHVSAETH